MIILCPRILLGYSNLETKRLQEQFSVVDRKEDCWVFCIAFFYTSLLIIIGWDVVHQILIFFALVCKRQMTHVAVNLKWVFLRCLCALRGGFFCIVFLSFFPLFIVGWSISSFHSNSCNDEW